MSYPTYDTYYAEDTLLFLNGRPWNMKAWHNQPCVVVHDPILDTTSRVHDSITSTVRVRALHGRPDFNSIDDLHLRPTPFRWSKFAVSTTKWPEFDDAPSANLERG